MAVYVGVALGLIIAGLVILWLSGGPAAAGTQGRPGGALLGVVLYWVAVICIVAGVVLFVAPIITWFARVVREALGV